LALLPILSAFYLSLIFFILENCLKNLKIPILISSFIDNGLFITQHKFISVLNVNLYCSYNVISSLLIRFELVIKHGKTEVFHFSRSHGVFSPLPLDLTALKGSVLLSKTIWQYLSFYFNQKLIFRHYINFYMKKAISTIKYMKMLGDSSRGLVPIQKRHLYICYMLPITLYSFQLWHYSKVPLNYPLRILRKIQQRAALWITRAFWTSLTLGIKAITYLIPIYLHLKKL